MIRYEFFTDPDTGCLEIQPTQADQADSFTAQEFVDKLINVAAFNSELDEIADLWESVECENDDAVRIEVILDGRINKHRERRMAEAMGEMATQRGRIGVSVCG